ncbi:hypothetical protein OPQ81_009824 [Rhizoctonia solani]|nr:hypothetical protein OPQ81_009824 [Rhizoctonia solani]
MSSGDLVLKWVWPDPEDLRNADLYSTRESGDVKEFQFETPPADTIFVTYFFRFNHHTGRFEEAGRLEWYPSSERAGLVHFGERQVQMNALHRKNKATSRSRRFKSNKDSWRRVVGRWSNESQTLTMTPGGFAIFDELVVTLWLQIWRREKGFW